MSSRALANASLATAAAEQQVPAKQQTRFVEEPPFKWKLKEQLSYKNGTLSTVYFVNGDRYIGEWKDNLKEGKGTYIRKNHESVYEGEWHRDQRSGFGTLSVRVQSADPSNPKTRDIASLVDRERSGSSSASSAKKKTVSSAKDTAPPMRKLYAGDWKDNMFGGYGTYFYADGTYFEGEWRENLQSGWGTRHYADGSRYDGEWLDGKRHGQGVLQMANHDKYEGMWMNDKKEGPGRYYYRSKHQIYQGEWAQDIPKCGYLVSTANTTTAAPSNGANQKSATTPRQNPNLPLPLPIIELADPEAVLQEQRGELMHERFDRLQNMDPVEYK